MKILIASLIALTSMNVSAYTVSVITGYISSSGGGNQETFIRVDGSDQSDCLVGLRETSEKVASKKVILHTKECRRSWNNTSYVSEIVYLP